MVGKHHLELHNKRVKYVLDIDRKVTVIKGNSGTGKTTFIRMLQGYLAQGSKSGIAFKNDSGISVVVLDARTRWEIELSEPTSRIIFVDEAVDYIYDQLFQQAFTKSNHYLVIISRSGKFNHLPYAINSIYELKTEKVEGINLTRLYQFYDCMIQTIPCQRVITEDSNSGAQLMEAVFGVKVCPAYGNSNVIKKLIDQLKASSQVPIAAVVDGAAFGGYIANVMNLIKTNENMCIYAPESIEFLLLQTAPYKRKVKDELENTWKYCDISRYLTWEQYYTELLCRICESDYGFSYKKTKLPQFFLTADSIKQVKECLGRYCVKETGRKM